MLNEQEKSLAYSRAYLVYAQIFQHGITDELLPLLESLSITETDGSIKDSAQHYNLFGRNVFPYQSIFLGIDGLLGGDITEAVMKFYHEVGFSAPDSETPDHIGIELALMSFLCAAETDAIADNVRHEIHRIQHLQRRFLDEQLLRWMPSFVCAVQQQGNAVYSTIAEQSLTLVLEHRASLGDSLMHPDSAFALPESPDLLSDEKTSLRDIARYFITPAYTGFFLSADDIRRLGAKYRLPHGFGKREQTLTNLFRTASAYEAFEKVLDEIQTLAKNCLAFYQGLEKLPASIQSQWENRLTETIQLLSDLRDTAAQFTDDETVNP